MSTAALAPFRYKQPGVAFDARLHRYTYHGHALPNVTGVLKATHQSASFGYVDEATLDAKRDLGLAVHQATELVDADDTLALATLDTALAGYVAAWRAFVAETGFRALLVETRLAHDSALYAGTLDRLGVLTRFDEYPTVVDIKTGSPEDAAAHQQTAAYFDAVRENLRDLYDALAESHDEALPWSFEDLSRKLAGDDGDVPARYSVRLKPDGTYRLHTYDNLWADLRKWRTSFACYVQQHPSWREA